MKIHKKINMRNCGDIWILTSWSSCTILPLIFHLERIMKSKVWQIFPRIWLSCGGINSGEKSDVQLSKIVERKRFLFVCFKGLFLERRRGRKMKVSHNDPPPLSQTAKRVAMLQSPFLYSLGSWAHMHMCPPLVKMPSLELGPMWLTT